MTFEEHFDLGNTVRGFVSAVAMLDDKATPLRQKNAIRRFLFDLLTQAEGRRIPDALRETFRQRCDSAEWRDRKGAFVRYVSDESLVGRTYGLFYAITNSGPVGLVRQFDVSVGTQDDSEDTRFAGGTIRFRRYFEDALTAVLETLRSGSGGSRRFSRRAVQQYRLRMASNGPSVTPLIFEGGSVGLALAVAAFSRAASVPVPFDVAVTGQISLHGTVDWVDAVVEKAASVWEELPHVKKFVLPEACRTDDLGDARYVFVRNLPEALDAVFGDWRERLSRVTLPGEVRFTWSADSAGGTPINVVTIQFGSEQVQADCLDDLDIYQGGGNLPHEGCGVVVDGAKINWLSSAIVAQLKNFVPFVAVHDPKLKGAVIVVSTSPEESQKAGRVIPFVPVAARQRSQN